MEQLEEAKTKKKRRENEIKKRNKLLYQTNN